MVINRYDLAFSMCTGGVILTRKIYFQKHEARGAGRDFLTMRRELNINRVSTGTGLSLLSFNVGPDLQMTTKWPLMNFEW